MLTMHSIYVSNKIKHGGNTLKHAKTYILAMLRHANNALNVINMLKHGSNVFFSFFFAT